MQFGELLKADFRNVFRDPTLIASAVAPVLITLVVVFLFPWVEQFVYSRWQVEIGDYYRVFSIFMAFIVAMVYGILSAFIIMDERDEDIICFIKVTPFSTDGYIRYRTGFALVSSVFALLFYLLILLLLGQFSLSDLLVLLVTVPLEAVCIALVVISFATNKVEGLAIAKMVGLIPFSAVAAYLIPGATVWLFSIFPPFWIVKTVEAATLGEQLLYGCATLLFHMFLIQLLIKLFQKRVTLT